jgi:hypothetical protein
MLKELGEHDNAIVLYPTGSLMEENAIVNGQIKHKTEFTVVFAGNLGEWYGRMLEKLVRSAEGRNIRIKIFGGNASWSKEFETYARETNIYRGQVPFDQLKKEVGDVDGLLLLMGFDPSVAQIEKTSFKTKFLDYLIFHKPILLWGPEYCSAVQIAREFDSAEICTSEDEKSFLNAIETLSKNPGRQETLVANSAKMYHERFHPDRIHEKLVSSIRRLIEN